MHVRFATVASLALLAACTDVDGWSYDHVGNYFSDEDIDTVIVDGDNTDVRLTGGSATRIEVVEFERSGGSTPDTRVEVEDGTLFIASDCPDNASRCGSKFEIDLPAGLVLDITMDVGAGDLRLYDLEGTADLRSGSGDLVASAFAGPVYAETGSGDVDAVDVVGPMVLDTQSGDVNVDGLIGDLWASTGSGDVDVARLEATEAVLATGSGDIDVLAYELTVLSATAGSGDVRAEAICDLVDIDVDTGSGDVVLDVAAGRYDIEVSTSSGDLRLVEVIDDPTAEATIDVHTGSGDIDIIGH